jgi:nitrite reductase/ring-hydroxylating ferredoxin subunit
VTERPGFTRVGQASQWKRRRGRRVVVDGAAVAVFRDGSRWIALDDTCPHMGASLADGRWDGEQLQCSWHEWRYDVGTGRCSVRPWAVVRVHEVAVEDGDVFVKLVPRPSEPTPPGTDDDPEWLDWDPARFFRK